MRRLSVMAVCILLGSVAACSTTEASPPPTPEDSLTDRAEASATATPDDAEQTSAAPTDAGEDPGIPELPEAATEDTEDGAEAFVQYYYDLINYTGKFPKEGILEPYADPECGTCDNFEKDARELADSDSRYDSDVLKANEIQALRFEDGYRVEVKGEAVAFQVLDRSGKVTARADAVDRQDVVIEVFYSAGSYQVESIKLVTA